MDVSERIHFRGFEQVKRVVVAERIDCHSCDS